MKDEYGDKNEISRQIFGLRDCRYSSGDFQVRNKLWMIVFMFICAFKCCANVCLPDSVECACKCIVISGYSKCFLSAAVQLMFLILGVFLTRYCEIASECHYIITQTIKLN